jgi:regulatory protein
MLSGEEVQQLRNDDRRRKAYQQAIRFLAIRNRSRMEMQRYLEKKDHGTELIQLTIERLVQENYINDLDFACQWIENRERSNPRGMYALRHELRQKGVEEPVIDEALMDVDEVASAWKAVQKRLYRWQGLDKINFQKKAGGFLNRRGFPSGVIHDTLEQAWEALKNDE